MKNTAGKMNDEAMERVNGGGLINYNNTVYVVTDDYNEKILGTYKYYIRGDDYSVCENAVIIAKKTAAVYGVSPDFLPIRRAPRNYNG